MIHRILFMGTPPFAVASLDALMKAGFDVAAVVTAPDRPAGRGRKIGMSAVKEYALADPRLKDRILQPVNLKDPTFLEQLDHIGASLYVVVAFRMLPESVWQRPALGTINLHASLLPDYRGAAPINWAVINGEQRTGVTTFFIRQAIDTGDVIHRDATPIGPDETAGELHDRLMHMGADLVVKSVTDILAGTVHASPQGIHGTVHTAPKLTPANCRIDWSRDAGRVHDHIRGLSPVPGAWTTLLIDDHAPQHFKILRSHAHPTRPGSAPGSIMNDGGRMFIACGTGVIEALEVQAEGKRRMDAAAFLRGSQGSAALRCV